MKKIKLIMLSMLTLFSFLAMPNCVNAATAATNESVTYLDNGCRIVTTIVDEPTRIKPGIQTYAIRYETTRSKISRYYNGSGEVMWYVKVTGTFSYDRKTCTCTKADVTAKALGSTWKVSQLSAARSGNTAYASCKATHYMANFVTNTMDGFVSLTCDQYGNLS